MGATISNLMKKNEEDQEEFAPKYDMKIEGDGVLEYSDEMDKKEVLWWERLLFDKRFRITYVLLLALFVGIVIPFIVFITKLETNDRTIYGSCLIEENARFQCLINAEAVEDENACYDAMCCWENSDDLPFKCYHSFPSAYQYIISDISMHEENRTEMTDLRMTSNQPNVMSELQVSLGWETQDHLSLQFFNPSLMTNTANFSTENRKRNLIENNDSLELSVSWANYDSFFYLRVARRETDETIFDTRLGPTISANNYITLATVLPTPYFYGLRGGQGALTTVTYGVVNGFENAELPFYISSEISGKWHGVLVDTTDPMLVQVVQAPGIIFHVETDTPKIDLHFFPGPTQSEILAQLHTYLQRKHQITHPPVIPPYWGLGLHLCRKVENITIASEHIQELLKEGTGIPFDSDCIDENLRRPIRVDEEHFANLSDTLSLLEAESKKIILSQQVTLPWDDDGSVENLPTILDTKNVSNIVPFKGTVDNETVKYIDFFNSNLDLLPLPSNISFHGMILSDNFPKLYNSSELCSPETRIQSLFTSPISNSNSSVNASLLWGSLCPEASHNTSNGNQQSYASHFKLHNTYGDKSLKLLHQTLVSSRNESSAEDMMITSSSIWITSLYYGGFSGLQVPFTWRGLQDSVAYTVRNYALAPVLGTPICGSNIFNLTLTLNNDLCLRWFQFGLLLPLTMNSYDGNSSYGPVHLPDQYKGYLAEAIRERYTYAPYYYTTLKQYQKNFLPFVRPLSFHFDSEKEKDITFPILNQFMIGDSILAAPIIDRGVTRTAYFPAGVWYSKTGQEAWNNAKVGSLKSITGHISETPLFIRGGHIIPTLQNPIGNSIEETLQGNYSIIVALSAANNEDKQLSAGHLTIKANNSAFHEIEFKASFYNGALTIIQNSTCAHSESNEYDDDYKDPPSISPEIGTIIDQIRVYGFPFFGTLDILVKTSESNYTISDYRYYGDENALRIFSLNLDWCTSDLYEIIVKRKSDNPNPSSTNTPETTTLA